MYCINYLVRSGVPTCDIFVFIVQSYVLFLNMHVQSGMLVSPTIISQDIERVQKRCLKLLYPTLSYNQALNKSLNV